MEKKIKILEKDYVMYEGDYEHSYCRFCCFYDDDCRIGTQFLCDVISPCFRVYFKKSVPNKSL